MHAVVDDAHAMDALPIRYRDKPSGDRRRRALLLSGEILSLVNVSPYGLPTNNDHFLMSSWHQRHRELNSRMTESEKISGANQCEATEPSAARSAEAV